ncbi:MAG: thiamine diphosphokinase, partial [Candidatus Limnocylindrales bacterium]
VPGTLVIGADGGAGRALRAGVHVDLVVGDLDSLDGADLDRLVAAGSDVTRAGRDKDESDTELALLAAIDRGCEPIVVLGALGGPRLDHELANLLLLAHPRLDDRDVSIVDGATTVRRIGTADGPGALDLEGAPGDLLTLLPLAGPVDGVTTHHLRYPLRGECLLPGPARGLSNELLTPTASVTTERGRLLVVHTRRSHSEEAP